MKKYIKWSGMVILFPFVVFIILCVLIYIPPIQNFLVAQATSYSSKATGMKIEIGRISLSFPLDLVVHNVQVADSADNQILSIKEITAEVQMLPLLKKEVELDGLTLKKASVNTGKLIEGMELNGELGEFHIESHGVAFDPETAIINQALLRDSHLSILLADTTASDTTASTPLYWKLLLKKIDFSNVSVQMQMPLDSLSFSASLGHFLLQNGTVDLHKMAYQADLVRLKSGSISYDYGMPADSMASGLNPSHICLNNIQTQMDSLYFCGNNFHAVINEFTFKEEGSGIEFISGKGSIASNEKTLHIPEFHLQTAESFIDMEAAMDWDATSANPAGLLTAQLIADFSKGDVMKLAGKLPEDFTKNYPGQPLRIRAGIDGNLNKLQLTTFTVTLPETFRIEMDGEINQLADSIKRNGEIRLNTLAENMSFVKALTGGSFAIPYGTSLNGVGKINGNTIDTELTLTEKQGTLKLNGHYDWIKEAYAASIHADNIQLHNFMPKDSLFHLTAYLQAEGRGTDVFSPATQFELEGGLSHLQYGNKILSGVELHSSLNQSNATADFKLKDNALSITAALDGLLTPKMVTANLNLDVNYLNWQELKLTNVPLSSSHKLELHAQSNLEKSHKLNLALTNTRLVTPQKTRTTKDLFVDFSTTKDSTFCSLNAGDMHLTLTGEKGIDLLGEQLTKVTDMLASQWKQKQMDLELVKSKLPNMDLQLTVGTDNPISNTLSTQGIRINKLQAQVNTSPIDGMSSNACMTGFATDSLSIDTIFFKSSQTTDGIIWKSGIQSSAQKNQEGFNILVDGNIGSKESQITIEYLNDKKERGAYIGLIGALQDKGISLHIHPDNPILVYRPFQVNPDNYIYLSDEGRIHANLTLHDENYTGVRFYSVADSTVQQDLTVELHRIRMSEFRRIIPYMPNIRGEINAEAHYVQADEENTQVSTELSVAELEYDGFPMGDWEFSGVYLPKGSDEHHIDGFLIHNGDEIATLNGSYITQNEKDAEGLLQANMDLHHFPLKLANAFVPDNMVTLSGDIDGNMAVKGTASKPILNGEIILDSVGLALPMASMNLRFDNKPVKVVDSQLEFNKFNIFTKGKTPFTIDGNINFSDFEQMTMNLNMAAHNFELFNAPRSKEALVYGKLYVDFNSSLRGPVNALVMRGSMNVLGKSNFTYVLKDSPLTVNDRLAETVTFVNFADTTLSSTNTVPKVELGTLDMLMVMHIDQAVQCRVDLNESQSNYILFEGGGDLSFQYNQQGNMLLNGRYTLISGEMKYEMPIIPLKTFHIKEGSYMEWTGDIMNPNLNLKATERVRAAVGQSGQSSRNVNFDVGVNITNRLENLGFIFTLEAPDDGEVQNQLAGMSVEEKNKLAVTMLVTGMYMAEGNSTGNFNTNNALNSFLQGQINNLTSSFDLNVGMESTNQEDGTNRTDYNFQFAKRFWNNRFRVVIGGSISTGNNVKQDETFIDNVSLEYRLDDSGTRYVKLFHNKNYESVLEGEIIETGAGIVLRKKVSRLGELFIFRKKRRNNQEAIIEDKKKTLEKDESNKNEN